MLSILKKVLKRNATVVVNNVKTDNLLVDVMLQNGRIWTGLLNQKGSIKSLHESEFKVFSQWGDDGIIQYLISKLQIENKTFVEFGVEGYLESNTRFLLLNNNWSGLVMDGSKKNIEKIKKNEMYWKHDLIAKSAFITAENINQLISEENIQGNIGLLHIDIDGNDYWVWKALETVTPVIMIVEYNSIFGYQRAITVPYRGDFVRTKAHYSNLYAGSSLLSLCDLAEEKGYAFVGSNSAGNNAYFVKKEALKKVKEVKELSVDEGYVESKFRESRDDEGKLNYLKGENRLNSLKGMPIYNTRLNRVEKI